MDAFTRRYLDCFVELQFAPNIFSLIVRGHLYCEAALASLVRTRLVAPDELDVDHLGYQLKVDLATALGFILPELKPALKALGALRNKYVHRLDYEVTEDDQRDFMNMFKSTLGPAAKYILRRGTEFPGGLRRTIIALWVGLELAGAPNREIAISMMASLTMVPAALRGDMDASLKEMAEECDKFFAGETGGDQSAITAYRKAFAEVQQHIRDRFPEGVPDIDDGPGDVGMQT